MADNNNRASRRDRAQREANRQHRNTATPQDYRPSRSEISGYNESVEEKQRLARETIDRFSNATVTRNGNEITFDIPDVEPITVNLSGDKYTCYPPKISVLMDVMNAAEIGDDLESMDALYEWVDLAFDEEDAADIRERIKDSRDPLDILHIGQLMQMVMEKDTGNPTM